MKFWTSTYNDDVMLVGTQYSIYFGTLSFVVKPCSKFNQCKNLKIGTCVIEP